MFKGLFWMIPANTWLIRWLVCVEKRRRTGGAGGMDMEKTERNSRRQPFSFFGLYFLLLFTFDYLEKFTIILWALS